VLRKIIGKAKEIYYNELLSLSTNKSKTSWNIILVNTQNVSVTKIVDSSSIQCAEFKYCLRIQFLAIVIMIDEVWLNA